MRAFARPEYQHARGSKTHALTYEVAYGGLLQVLAVARRDERIVVTADLKVWTASGVTGMSTRNFTRSAPPR